MIAVISDDFTGAAELGGLALRYGLDVEIETSVIVNRDFDLLIVATDTRSMSASDAAKKVSEITKELLIKNLELIYKKIDSVLRGHVLSEVEALKESTECNTILVVPANPSLMRTIKDGNYFINDKLLHETDFANDPEFPLSTSNVLELIGYSDKTKVTLSPVENNNYPDGIVIGEAVSNSDLACWAKSLLAQNIALAGAAGFFASLLEQKGFEVQNSRSKVFDLKGRRCLYVCGSAIDTSRKAVEKAKKNGATICQLSIELISNHNNGNELISTIIQNIEEAFKKDDRVIISVSGPVIKQNGVSKKVRDFTAEVVNEVLKRVKINELFIEGGATVYSILQATGLKQFIPKQELALGVLRMKVAGKENLYLTLKPGSYSWPKDVWDY